MRCTVLLLLAISVYAFFLMFQEGAASDVVIPDRSNSTFSSSTPRPTLNPRLHPTLNPKLRPPNHILQDKDEQKLCNILKGTKNGRDCADRCKDISCYYDDFEPRASHLEKCIDKCLKLHKSNDLVAHSLWTELFN